jgi:GxxExxY protein
MEQDHRDPRTYAIIGAALEVHRELGCGFLEPVYQEALGLELKTQGVPFEREVKLPVFYTGHRLETHYQADFICYDNVIVELKALAKTGGLEQSQVLNYLKATGHRVGLLANFGAMSLQWQRLVR